MSENCTETTPTLSLAVADTVTVPLTVAPEPGAVRLTNGLVVSPSSGGSGVETLLTVTVRVADVVSLPAASRATARSVWVPFAAPVVSQLRL